MEKDKLIKYFDELVDSLEVKKYPDEINSFYVSKSNNILYIESAGTSTLYIDKSKVWDTFKSNNIMNIEKIIKPILEKN
ncbi:hypothetical protein COB55_04430 [Candidatus Wolfebacteria bacterium]|nr:MAG: hypothetical protein COB55_04430 [Candidatus Wolfebacteria bacterium]